MNTEVFIMYTLSIILKDHLPLCDAGQLIMDSSILRSFASELRSLFLVSDSNTIIETRIARGHTAQASKVDKFWIRLLLECFMHV